MGNNKIVKTHDGKLVVPDVPTISLLSGAMMLDHIGWQEAAAKVREALRTAVRAKAVTYDLARQMEGATKVKCSEFAQQIVSHMG